jgi:hypothetical protein
MIQVLFWIQFTPENSPEETLQTPEIAISLQITRFAMLN